jgi:hypothetical protein
LPARGSERARVFAAIYLAATASERKRRRARRRITVESRSAAFGGDHLRVSSKAFAQQSFQQPARVTRLTANV